MTILSNPSKRATRQTPADALASIGLLTATDRAALAATGIKSIDDLADLATDELLDIIGADNMPREIADQIIMAARAHWFAPAH